MKTKNLFLILLLACVIFSISSVAASDAADTILNNDDSKDVAELTSDTQENSITTKNIGENDQDPILKAEESSSSSASNTTASSVKKVEKEKTKITIKSVSGKQGKKVKLTATVKTAKNKVVKNAKLTFTVNGKKYTAKTNSKGKATVTIKIPRAKLFKVKDKTKKSILTRTKIYKKAYSCKVSFDGTDKYTKSSKKFKVTSKKKSKVQKYRVIKKKKSVILPTRKYITQKKVGKYRFAVMHEMQEAHKLTVAAGDFKAKKYIKFKSNIYYQYKGKVKYVFKKWTTSKHSTDSHIYYYSGDADVFVHIKYTAVNYKKIRA